MQRRKFTTQIKQQVVQECIETGSPSVVARKHELNPNVVRRWVRQFKQNGGTVPNKQKGNKGYVTNEEHQHLASERAELASENEKLKKVLREQALENSILRDLLKKINPHWQTK